MNHLAETFQDLARIEEAMELESKSFQNHPRYAPYCELFEDHSIFRKLGRPIPPQSRSLLLRKFRRFEEYLHRVCVERGISVKNINEVSSGTLADLGRLPDIAFGTMAIQHGASVAPLIADQQMLTGRHGYVYVQELKAVDTRGSHAAGDKIWSPDGGMTTNLSSYAAGKVTHDLGDTVSGDLVYATGAELTVPTILPILPGAVRGTVALGTPIYFRDYESNPGIIVPDRGTTGILGTINYDTGAITLTFSVDPAATAAITLVYQQNFEGATDVPEVQTVMSHKNVDAYEFILKEVIGLIKNWEMEQTLGINVMDDLTVQSLVSGLTSEIDSAIIATINANKVGNTNYTFAAGTGVTVDQQRQDFLHTILAAGTVLAGNAGRGLINCLVVGNHASSVVGGLKGFKADAAAANQIGPHLYGTFDGIPVIRVIQTNIVATDDVIGIFKPDMPFQAAAVNGIWMPLFMTNTIQSFTNPLMSQRMAATIQSVDPMLPKFATGITIVV
jgi:hypothetical protein